MYKGVLLLFVFLSHFCTASHVSVTYLIGVPRLNNISFWDYYFFCQTVGEALIWNVNGSGLNGFVSGNLPGQVVFGQTANFAYIASLQLSEPVNIQFSFYSILIISQAGNLHLDIICSNGPSSAGTSNTGNVSNIAASMSMNSVFEQYLLSTDLVGENITYTSIFICEVQNTFMYWNAGKSFIGFTELDQVGQERRIIEPDTTYVNQQGILIDRKPNLIVSVFFITSTSNETVACGDFQNEVNLTTNYGDRSYNGGPTPQAQTTKSELSSSSTSLSFSTSVKNGTASELTIILAVAITIVIILICGCALIVAVVVVIACMLRKWTGIISNPIQETELRPRKYPSTSPVPADENSDSSTPIQETELRPRKHSSLFHPTMSSGGGRQRKTFKSSSNIKTTPEPVKESRFPISQEQELCVAPSYSRKECEKPETDDKPDNEQEWEPETDDESSTLIQSDFFDPVMKDGERHQRNNSKRSSNAKAHWTPRGSPKNEGSRFNSSFTSL